MNVSLGTLHRENSLTNRDSIDGTSQVLNSQNLQLLMLSSELVASFIELPALKLPGGGVTAGLVTANRQVRILLRDLNGKACWDASILYKEPSLKSSKNDSMTSLNSTETSYSFDRQSMLMDRSNTFQSRQYSMRPFIIGTIDPMISTVGLPLAPLRHTLRHRPVHQLPVAKDLAPDLDQLDDLLQYIGHTSPECLNASGTSLNTAQVC